MIKMERGSDQEKYMNAYLSALYAQQTKHSDPRSLDAQ